MKIKKVNLSKSKLFNIKLIKSKMYKKHHLLKTITLENIKSRLKKALYIIYFYHINNKKILFVGNPLNINKELKKLLKKTKHSFISQDTWIPGVITNQNVSFKSFFRKQENNKELSKILLQLKKKSDLIVIIDEETDKIALKESFFSRIPSISLNSNLSIGDLKSTYKIPGNFIFPKKNLSNNFFYSCLISTLNKSNKIIRKFPNIQHKLNTKTILDKQKKRKKIYRR